MKLNLIKLFDCIKIFSLYFTFSIIYALTDFPLIISIIVVLGKSFRRTHSRIGKTDYLQFVACFVDWWLLNNCPDYGISWFLPFWSWYRIKLTNWSEWALKTVVIWGTSVPISRWSRRCGSWWRCWYLWCDCIFTILHSIRNLLGLCWFSGG